MAKKSNNNGSAAHLGFEAKVWLAADKLRNNMDAARAVTTRQEWARRAFLFGGGGVI